MNIYVLDLLIQVGAATSHGVEMIYVCVGGGGKVFWEIARVIWNQYLLFEKLLFCTEQQNAFSNFLDFFFAVFFNAFSR